MKDSTSQLLKKAQRAIQATETLCADSFLEFAVGRAYYVMFYIAEALLNDRNLRFSKHGGVHGAFGEHFVKTGLFDSKYHRRLLNAFNRRIIGDYSVSEVFREEEVVEMIHQAREFLHEAHRYLTGPELH